MNTYKDDLTGLNYLDFEELVDEYDVPEEMQLIINDILVTHIHDISRKLIELNGVISFLRYGQFTNDELIVYKYRLNSLYFELSDEYDNSKERDGYWKYLDVNYTIDILYKKVVSKPSLELSEIFEDDNFLKNMMQIGGKYKL
jgi:hypothetical protein